jgi:hypothetical protein
MPISLRLPLNLETEVAERCEREGVSKTALVVRSIEDYLQRTRAPSAFELFEQAMSAADVALAQRDAELARVRAARPHKRAVVAAIQAKRASRAGRAA